MVFKISITICLTIILIGVPYLILKNFKQTIVRSREKLEWFNDLKGHPVESIHLRVWLSNDSLLTDSTIIDKKTIEGIKTEYLELPGVLNSIPRLIWTKRIELTFVLNNSDRLNSMIYVTQYTALIFIPTQSARNFEGLDDFYSNKNVGEVLADFK